METIEAGRPAGRQLPAGLWLHDCGRTGLCSHISSVDTYFVRFSFRVHDLNVDRESRSLKVDRRSRSPTENPQIDIPVHVRRLILYVHATSYMPESKTLVRGGRGDRLSQNPRRTLRTTKSGCPAASLTGRSSRMAASALRRPGHIICSAWEPSERRSRLSTTPSEPATHSRFSSKRLLLFVRCARRPRASAPARARSSFLSSSPPSHLHHTCTLIHSPSITFASLTAVRP